MVLIDYLRQFHVGEYAIFDLAVSFLGVYFLAPLLSKLFLKLRLDIPKRNWLFLTLPVSILAHILVGRITPMTANFMNLSGHYILKIFILGLLYFGLKGIKRIEK